MVRWPTSLLPMTPSGSPTARPLASRFACGYDANSASSRGVLARVTARRLQRREVGRDLPRHHGVALAGEILRLALADAEDGPQAGRQHARQLRRDARVVIAEVAAHLGVADDRADRVHAQHRHRGLSGVRALL